MEEDITIELDEETFRPLLEEIRKSFRYPPKDDSDMAGKLLLMVHEFTTRKNEDGKTMRQLCIEHGFKDINEV